jgi:chaperonin GroEL (HSP60 family)
MHIYSSARLQLTLLISCLSILQDTLAPYVAEACLNVMPPAPKKASVNVENVRICKLQGGSVDQCHVINGMVKLQILTLLMIHTFIT